MHVVQHFSSTVVRSRESRRDSIIGAPKDSSMVLLEEVCTCIGHDLIPPVPGCRTEGADGF